MLILQALFLWLIVSALIVGGAMIFHRLYPEESPWFGFLVPSAAIVAFFNFVEHLVALPSLLYLLPVFLIATVWFAVKWRWFTPALVLPTAIFLGCFAFTFAIRCLQPDITYGSDGISDLNMINNFLQGSTLPPPDTWMPGQRFEWYYDLQHYAASLMERLLGVKIGVAYNVSHALLSTLICVTAAGAAHRLSGGKLWITIAMPLLIEASLTGSSAYLFLTSSTDDLWVPFDLSGGTLQPPNANPIWHLIMNSFPAGLQHLPPDQIAAHQTLRLQPPGFWTWRDEYHANASGHLLTIFAVLVVAELYVERRTLWPWALGGLLPVLAATTSAWALPITTLLCWVSMPIAWACGRRPASNNAALIAFFGGFMLLWPAFYQVTSSPEFPQVTWIDPLDRVPLVEFLIQWWPIIVLWICSCICFRQLSFGTRWLLVVVPLMLIGIETITIESRYNTIEKLWGYTWAAGLVGLFPIIAARPAVAFRLVTFVLLGCALISLGVYTHSALGSLGNGETFQIDGTKYIRDDPQKNRIMQKLMQTHGATYLSGKCVFCYNEAPAVAVFTGNRSYIAWFWFESLTDYIDEADAREKQDNDFYSGAMTDRLGFLQSHDISGVLIWPDDNIPDADLAKLRQELAPAYDYIDYKGNGPNNAGVFILRSGPKG